MVSSGPISIGGNATTGGLNQSINIELGRSASATSSLNESALRTLAGVASGAISLSNFYGKANSFAFTISTNQTNANLRTLAVNAGWNESTKVVATIGAGVYISSNSTGTPALTVNGSFPNGVELINNGFIIGRGGNGGLGGSQSAGSAGAGGGLALSVSSAISINNAGTVGGGGGGGGGGQSRYYEGKASNTWYGGGGGGGGRSSNAANSSGGGGGVIGTTYGGSAGGTGTVSSAGGGGAGGAGTGGAGGSGGGWGSAGSTGSTGFSGSIAGLGPYSGGSGGGAITGNSNITWVATGTRLGSIT
jgi:hypothetical protein